MTGRALIPAMLCLGAACGHTLSRSGLPCPEGAEAHHTVDADRSAREWCELPSGQRDCVYYVNCEVPGTSHGPWVRFYPDGRKHEETTVVNGRESGLHLTWFNDGTPEQSTHWRDGQREGEEMRWRGATRLAWLGSYHENRREGAWQGWHPNGAPAWAGSYRDGRPVGTWTFWTADGTVSREQAFDVEPPAAFWTWGEQACPSGSVLSGGPPPAANAASCVRLDAAGRVTYDGPMTTWDLNGQLSMQGSYRDGKKHGRFVYWTSLGVPATVEEYERDVRHGAWMRLDDFGVLLEVVDYEQGTEKSRWQAP